MPVNPQQSQQIVQQVVQVMGKLDVQTLHKFYDMAKQALQDPNKYQQLLQAAIQSGKVKQGELPQQYDEKVVKAIVLALQIAIEHKNGKFGQGGQQQQPQQPQPMQMPQNI